MSGLPPPIVECVPNVSEGRDARVLDALRAAIVSVPSVHLLHVDAGVDAHRTVFTFAGPPEAVGDAAIALGHAVAAHIDMRTHHGAHPRIGALDVCPFVPMRGVSMARCVQLARRVGATLAHDLSLPVYLYEEAAYRPERRLLAPLRRGGYEGLAARMALPEACPDFGPARPSARLGASVVGARPFLIAWNVSLATRDIAVARRIAARMRQMPAVRAVGWDMPAYGLTQVSMNLVDFTVTPMHEAYATVVSDAAEEGTTVVGSELIGLVPEAALLEAGRAALEDVTAGEAAAIAAAVSSLGLDHLGPFDADARILERRLDASIRADTRPSSAGE